MTNTTRLVDGRTFVSSLGGGLPTIPRIGATRVTIDGGNVTTPGTAGVLLQVSQDVVQEFQIATVNFDPGRSLTSNGAINIVTRSGTNTFQGSGFYFYRDHHLAAYPGIERVTRATLIRRSNAAVRLLRRRPAAKRSRILLRKLRANRPGRGGVGPATRAACGARRHLSDTLYRQSDQPARGCTAASQSLRIRALHLRSQQHVREPRPIGPAVELVNRANQTEQRLAALTSVLSPRLVNDLRFSHFPTTTAVTSATADDCPNCFGLGAVRTIVENTGVIFGSNTGSTSRPESAIN